MTTLEGSVIIDDMNILHPLYRVIESRGRIPMSDLTGRPLICVPIRAHYGAVSHWVLSVEGTPPRGTIIFDTTRYTPPRAFMVVQQSFYRIGQQNQYSVIDNFVRENLED